jgi:hypothetical protein
VQVLGLWLLAQLEQVLLVLVLLELLLLLTQEAALIIQMEVSQCHLKLTQDRAVWEVEMHSDLLLDKELQLLMLMLDLVLQPTQVDLTQVQSLT